MTHLEFRAVIVKNPANACQAKARKSADVRYQQDGLGRRARTGKRGSPISRSARGPQTPAGTQAHPGIDGQAPSRHRGETAGRRPLDPAAIGPGTHGPPAPTGGGRQQRRHAGAGGRVREGGARLQPAQGHHLCRLAGGGGRPRSAAPGGHPPGRRGLTAQISANRQRSSSPSVTLSEGEPGGGPGPSNRVTCADFPGLDGSSPWSPSPGSSLPPSERGSPRGRQQRTTAPSRASPSIPAARRPSTTGSRPWGRTPSTSPSTTRPTAPTPTTCTDTT